jgi:hypothetical protein
MASGENFGSAPQARIRRKCTINQDLLTLDIGRGVVVGNIEACDVASLQPVERAPVVEAGEWHDWTWQGERDMGVLQVCLNDPLTSRFNREEGKARMRVWQAWHADEREW